MPEYLSPAVYVEEINTGSKPIEGVSTSTTGMVGVTERGPENVPILVTSTGDYSRTFGGQLEFRAFTTAATGTVHAYLPYAVEGYFTNGGRRDYVVRVLPENARAAARPLFDRGVAVSAETLLLRAAPRDSGSAVNPPLLYVLADANLGVGEMVRIGNGSRSEYREVANIGADNLHVALSFPLRFAYGAFAGVDEFVRQIDTANYAAGDFVLAAAAPAGSTSINIGAGSDPADLAAVPGLPGDALFEIVLGASAEYITATAATDLGGGVVRLTLAEALHRDYPAAAVVNAIDLSAGAATSAQLEVDANSGDVLIYLDDLQGAFSNTANLVRIDDGTSSEVRRIGALSSLTLDLGAYANYRQGALIERVDMNDFMREVVAPGGDPNTATEFDVDDLDGLVPGLQVVVGANPPATIAAVHTATSRITVQPALAGGPPAAGNSILPLAKALTAAAAPGNVVIALNDRMGLRNGDVLRIGNAPDEEYATIASIDGPRGAAPDAGNVILATALAQAHPDATAVTLLAPVVDAAAPPAQTIFPAAQNQSLLYVNDGSGYAALDVLRITTPGGGRFHHVLSAVDPGLDGRSVELNQSINFSHDAGSPVVERAPMFDVQALDRGGWGNRLLVSVQDEAESLASRATVSGFNPPQELNLTTLTGVEAGTVLELRDPVTDALAGAPLKVRAVDRSANNLVVLDGPGLQAAHIAALNNAQMAGAPLLARSREFALTVYLLERPHPAVPTRNEDIRDSETFRHLSMDPRHSRYIHQIIGTTWTPGNTEDDDGNPLRISDRRSEGESAYIRVRDRAPDDATAESIRLGPEALTDTLASGRIRPARHRLGEASDPATGFVRGSDSVDTMSDAMYEGADSNEPRERTGIFALGNVQDISLVAVPGQTTAAVQQALIDHCEADRYRFAVIDAFGPDNDSLADVQFQRQQFDSKYAAIYHPWLTIPEPMPANLANINQVALPPSGHVLGIYARTDNERGVHKAPANTVLRGITGLTRSLNKGEHDILNPFPRNINVLRDFRENNRGLRVWGARVITSDSDYKYVNVRRLLIFIEASIDRGLQWVVFEPNEEDLWARVRRSIGNFLTVVWRNGALEGERAEQAFFVKCDRTTMTQTDIDNGRLICVVGVAPVKPAEFVIVRIGLWTANTQQ
ncbi:MAG: phage tail sheath C-terminal domain-containing protein [Wenzhouxiangellaceae bacterium]